MSEITLGLMKNAPRVWVFVWVAAVCLLLTGLLVRLFRQNRQGFYATALAVCVLVSLAGGWGYLTFGKITITTIACALILGIIVNTVLSRKKAE